MSDVTKATATARVRVEIEIDLSQPWSGGSPVDQVFAQAAREARERVGCLMKGEARIISTQVTAILTPEAKR